MGRITKRLIYEILQTVYIRCKIRSVNTVGHAVELQKNKKLERSVRFSQSTKRHHVGFRYRVFVSGHLVYLFPIFFTIVHQVRPRIKSNSSNGVRELLKFQTRRLLSG